MDKQQIKQILDNAPEGAVDFCKVGLYGCLFRFYYDSGVHEDVEIESLTDVGCPYATIETLRNQLALIEENEKLKDALNAAIRACYDLDTHSVRESNSDYNKACEILDEVEGAM